jgi:hypothetical protein
MFSLDFLRPINYAQVSGRRLRVVSVMWMVLTACVFGASFAWIYSDTTTSTVISTDRHDDSCVPQNDLPPITNGCVSSADIGSVRIGRDKLRGFVRELSVQLFHEGLHAPLLRHGRWYGFVTSRNASLVFEPNTTSVVLEWNSPAAAPATRGSWTTQELMRLLPPGLNELLVDGLQPCLAPVICYDVHRKSVVSTVANACSITMTASFAFIAVAQAWLGNPELSRLLPGSSKRLIPGSHAQV